MNNAYIIVPIVAWVVAQVLKFGLRAYKGDINGHYLYASGGMPSSHAAIVSALALTALTEEGFNSPAFGISVVVALIVMVDAFNVRRAVGENRQAVKTLYRLVPLAKRRTKDDDVLERDQALGHTPTEVIVGAFVGALTTLLLLYNQIVEQTGGPNGRVFGAERLVYLYIGIGLLVIGLFLHIFAVRGRAKTLKTGRKLRRSFRHSFIYPGIVLIILYWGQVENIAQLNKRIAIYLAMIWAAANIMYYSHSLYNNLAQRYIEDDQRKRSLRDLNRKRRKKSKKRR